MSRADREKSLYIIRLNQIRNELKMQYPEEFKELQYRNKMKQEQERLRNADDQPPSQPGYE